MLSPYSKLCIELLGGKTNYRERKLTATFNDRIKYVIHGENLKTYLKLGMKLKKIHRAVKFKQSNYLKDYIDFCTSKRAAAKTKFLVTLFKLMANAVFGKFLEDVTKHLDAHICGSAEDFLKYSAFMGYVGTYIISDALCIVYVKKKVVKIERPFFTGFSILELSKNYMYKSYYNHFTVVFKNVRILFSDTDSLFMSFTTENRNTELTNASYIMDFSNYPKTHELFNTSHKKQLGYFSDEMGGRDICEFIGIRSKCYAIKSLSEKNAEEIKKICKGVRKNAVFKKISYRDYRNCIKNIQSISTSMKVIRSQNHNIKINNINKVAFTSFDSKRYLMDCGIHTLPYGHYRLNVDKIKCHFCKMSE
jgi:hypothetical protein